MRSAEPKSIEEGDTSIGATVMSPTGGATALGKKGGAGATGTVGGVVVMVGLGTKGAIGTPSGAGAGCDAGA